MKQPLKVYHKILPLLIIPTCLFLLAVYGWTGYATLSERPGARGDWYLYLDLNRHLFYTYNFVVALIALTLITAQTNFLLKSNPRLLTKTLWFSTIFFGLLVVTEIYLQTRFVSKA